MTSGTVWVILKTSQKSELLSWKSLRKKGRCSAESQTIGGAYKRATFIDKVCRNKADRGVLDTLCQKSLVEKGLGGTVAGDVYDGCWLTEKGKAAESGPSVP